MKSSLRMLGSRKPPVPIADGGARGLLGGHAYNLGSGRQDNETAMRQYGLSGTVYSIVSLLAEAAATTTWHLYKKQPVDGRRRYTTADQGSDQRVEVVQHAAIQMWNNPNDYNSGFEFREASQQHQELTGETFWVLDNEVGFPTAMYYVRPDRMFPLASDDELLGWMYTGPQGQQIPLDLKQVILEKRPDPLDPFRGSGPVGSVLPNIQQQRYATEYQRNLFLNGSTPGGLIQLPEGATMSDHDFDQFVDRWRESHRGVARAGLVGFLENGATWIPAGSSNKDLEYGNLRLANRDELREAWRIHKSMLGSTEDVNRANAQTAEEVFVAWQVLPRLNRRRDTLNNKLLPLFGDTGKGVEFDYEDPSPVNAETAVTEMLGKAQAAQALVATGYDPSDVLEVVGLPDMDFGAPTPLPNPAPTAPVPPALEGPEKPAEGQPQARERISITAASNAATKAFEAEADQFPPSAIAWMHHADWKGPVEVPLNHIDWTPDEMEKNGQDPQLIQKFVDRLQAGKKVKPVILVKTPSGALLHLVDGHHRYLAAAELKMPVRAYIGTVDMDHGPWEAMHTHQEREPANLAPSLSALLRKGLIEGYKPINGTAHREDVNHA